MSGTGSIGDPRDPTTTIALTGSAATATANFGTDEISAVLTMSVSPSSSGSTNPGAGERPSFVGEVVQIAATAASGYHFTGWSVSGTGSIGDLRDPTTTVALTGAAATVTAFFGTDETSAVLSMAVNPAGSGSTSPGVGVHACFVGQVVEVTALPGVGYHFTGWSVSGTGSIGDPSDPTTTVALTGAAATATANFGTDETPAVLTMAVNPVDAGSTSPGVGGYPCFVGHAVELAALPGAGYHFTGWSVSGTGSIGNLLDPTTTIALTGAAATATANFVKNETSAVLSMVVLPADSGFTTPGVGSHACVVGQIVELAALSGVGYHFAGWSVSGTGSIGNQSDPTTTVALTGVAATVTATFAVNSDEVKLTMAVEPAAAGSTSPAAGDYGVHKGEPVEIAATPAGGYVFLRWSSGGGVVVGNPYERMTTAILTEAATVTAVFDAEGGTLTAFGSVTSLAASEVGLATFSRAVKASTTYPMLAGGMKSAKLNIVDKPSNTHMFTSVNAAWNVRTPLYDKKYYAYGTEALSALLLQKPIQPSTTTTLVVSSKELAAPVELKRSLTLVPPVIVGMDWGENLPGAIIMLHGIYFGSSAPKVYLELESLTSTGKKYSLKQCMLARSNAAGKALNFPFMNAAYKKQSSCMKIYADDNPDPLAPKPVGYSEVYVLYPTYNMSKVKPTGYLIIMNSAGMAAYKFKGSGTF